MADRSDKTEKGDTRYGGTRPLAALVPGIAKKAVGKRGFTDARILNDWENIVGPDVAAHAHPDRLSFQKGKRDGGILHIRAEGPIALELQHLEPLLIERINAHFGYRAVDGIRLHQVPLERTAKAKTKKSPPFPPPDPGQIAALQDQLKTVEDPELRAILERIGISILQRDAKSKA